MRLVLDEHIAEAVALELRGRGHDVVAVTEDPSLRGLADVELFRRAAGAGRVIVTYDAAGFMPLAKERQARDEAFPAIMLLSSKRYPQRPRALSALVRDLAQVLDKYPEADALNGRAIWLGRDQ